MKYFVLIYIVIAILFGCTVNKKMSDHEIEIVKKAISLNETSAVADAKVILDRRIKKFNLKHDWILKVQLLVVTKEYDRALEVSEQLIKRFPDYIEMIVLHCVLSKYILPLDAATIIYQQSVKQIQIIAERLTNLQQQYNALSNLMLLHCLFEDAPNKHVCLEKINNPDAKHRGCCSHKVVAVGFNTLCYDAERRGIKPSARINSLQLSREEKDIIEQITKSTESELCALFNIY